MSIGAIIRGHKTLTVLCPLFITAFSRSTGHRTPQEMHADISTQDAEMTRKQHKRGNISKQYNRREMHRETRSKMSYKSDTMQYKLHTIESNKSDTKAGTFTH